MPIETKLISLNSNNAIKQNSTFLSSVYFPFPALIINKNNIKKIQISILNAELPYSFYIINIYNNVLRLDVNGGIPFSITLTRGNYNGNTLITEILAQLALAGVTTISIALSTITGSLTFTTTGTSFTFYSTGSTILRVLGFDPTTNYTSVAKVLTSPYPLNLLNTLKIRICSYALASNSLDSAVSGSLNLLASFAVNAQPYGLNLYENATNIKTEIQVRDLNGFDIQILDDDSNLINFNSVYWTITMLLEIEYDDEMQPYSFNPNYTLPSQSYWGADPNQTDNNPPIENLPPPPPPPEENPPEDFIQTEPPPIKITDENDLGQLLQSYGIYT